MTTILIRCILEIIGAPKEHIDKSLKDFVKSLKEREELKFVRSNYSEPEPQGNLFSMFVELDIKMGGFRSVLDFIIDAMPSSIEILEPDSLSIDSGNLTSSLNDYIAKMHSVDLKLKTTAAQNKNLEKNTQTLASNLVGLSLKDGGKSLATLVSITGIPEDKMVSFLEHLEKEGRVKKKDDLFVLP